MTTRSCRQKGELSPYKQRLQTNAPVYENIDMAKKNIDWHGNASVAPSHQKEQSNLLYANDNDGSSSCSRPDVLSLDSDFDSGNCLTESPDHDSSSPSFEKADNKRQSKRSAKQSPNTLRLQESFNYCTPPGHMASAISRVHIGKTGGHKKKSASGGKFVQGDNFQYNAIVDPVSSNHNYLPQGLYGRPPINGKENGLSARPDDQSGASALPVGASYKNSLPVAKSQKRQVVQEAACKEAMDMKFTDLTHLQLKKSLEQIHRQNITGTATYLSSADNIYASAGAYRDPSAKMNGVQMIPSAFYNPVASDQFQMGSQPSKYDAILKVKDAMLQEKEAVILKLRLELSSLQHQVQEGETALRQVIQAKNIPPNVVTIHSSSGVQNPATEIAFRKKIHNLEEMLGKAEYQLSELQSQQFQDRKGSDDKIKTLESTLKTKDQTFSETKKKYKQNLERVEKYKKRVESLERYLGDLPTLEESKKLKTEAGMLGEERGSLREEVTTLKQKLEVKTKSHKEKEFIIEQHALKEKQLRKQIETLEEKLSAVEKSKQDLGTTERDEFDDLKFENDRLRREQENATKMVAACDRRMKQHQERHAEEISVYKQKLNDAEETNENMRREQFLKQQTANKVHTAMMNLSSQNQQLMEQKLTLQEKVKKMEKSQSAIEGETQAYKRLHRETHSAVHELKAVTQVLLQTAEGTDPNLSALLGVRGDLLSATEDGKSPTKLSGSDAGDFEDPFSLERTNKSIGEVRNLRKDLDQLRTMMTNRYAENIGENCTTQ